MDFCQSNFKNYFDYLSECYEMFRSTASAPLTDDEIVLEEFFGSGEFGSGDRPTTIPETTKTASVTVFTEPLDNTSPTTTETVPSAALTETSFPKATAPSTTPKIDRDVTTTAVTTGAAPSKLTTGVTTIATTSSSSLKVTTAVTPSVTTDVTTSVTTDVTTSVTIADITTMAVYPFADNTTVINGSNTTADEITSVVTSVSISTVHEWPIEPEIFWSVLGVSIFGWFITILVFCYLYKKRRRYTPRRLNRNSYAAANLTRRETEV